MSVTTETFTSYRVGVTQPGLSEWLMSARDQDEAVVLVARYKAQIPDAKVCVILTTTIITRREL